MSQEIFEIAIEDGDLTTEELHEVLEDKDVTEGKIKKQLNKFYEKAKKIIDDKDKVKEVLAKAKKIFKKLSNIPLLGRYLNDIAMLCDMISDYIDKSYTVVPIATIICILASIIYLVSPIDLLPDTLPGIGYLDDIGLMGVIIEALSNDINSYREWKTENIESEGE